MARTTQQIEKDRIALDRKRQKAIDKFKADALALKAEYDEAYAREHPVVDVAGLTEAQREQLRQSLSSAQGISAAGIAPDASVSGTAIGAGGE